MSSFEVVLLIPMFRLDVKSALFDGFPLFLLPLYNIFVHKFIFSNHSNAAVLQNYQTVFPYGNVELIIDIIT